jgi:hypothetical protein
VSGRTTVTCRLSRSRSELNVWNMVDGRDVGVPPRISATIRPATVSRVGTRTRSAMPMIGPAIPTGPAPRAPVEEAAAGVVLLRPWRSSWWR